MFPNTDLLFIFGPAMAIAAIFLFISKRRIHQRNLTEMNGAIENFKITLIVFGFLLSILWLALPSTPALKTFGYPKDLTGINTEERILHLLQEYNKAIVRTTEVLYWFIFLFIWWFLTTLFGVAKAYSSYNKKTLALEVVR